MAGLFSRIFDPQVSSHLIADEGEIVIDEVKRHWMAIAVPILELLLALVILTWTFWQQPRYYGVPLALVAALAVHAGARIWSTHMDRFVITNMRVFRVYGVFSHDTATMPLMRILDIAVHKPFAGRIFNYGHFLFESAAQDQGLRAIRFVGRPDERDLTIQRVIQRSGLRNRMRGYEEDAGL